MTKLVADHVNPRMKEFDPKCEHHFPVLIVKMVEPGCTTELQIENCLSGKITRLTTTDCSKADDKAFTEAVVKCFSQALEEYEKEVDND